MANSKYRNASEVIEEIKDRIKNHPENVEILYEPRCRSFFLYDFNNIAIEGAEGQVRYRITKELLLELLIEHGEFISF